MPVSKQNHGGSLTITGGSGYSQAERPLPQYERSNRGSSRGSREFKPQAKPVVFSSKQEEFKDPDPSKLNVDTN